RQRRWWVGFGHVCHRGWPDHTVRATMAHVGGSSKLLRAMNDAAALSHVLERGPLTRGELRDLTGLSKPTISEALRRLTEARLVSVVGYVSAGPGPNAEVYAVNPDAAYAVAL